MLAVRVMVSPQARTVPPLSLQLTVNEGAGPSGSDADTAQVSLVFVRTSVGGLITTELMIGAEFSITALLDAVSVPPYPSTTEAVQTISSPGDTSAGVSNKVAVVERLVELPLTLQSYVGDTLSLSASEAVAAQVTSEEVVIPVEGLIVGAVTTGLRLSRIVVAAPESLSPSVSVAVTEHSRVSVGDATELSRVTVLLVPSAAPVVLFVH